MPKKSKQKKFLDGVKKEAPDFKKGLSEILDDTRSFINSYIIITPEQATTIALWTASTYVYTAFDVVPYISVRSAIPASGKTLLMEVAEKLSWNPRVSANITAATLAHYVDKGCSLFVDEVDTIFKANGDDNAAGLRSLINAGNKRSGKYSRMYGTGTTMEPKEYSAFSPKMLVGMGKLPRSTETRCLIVYMVKKSKKEKVQPFMEMEVDELAAPIKEQFKRWTTPEVIGELAKSRRKLIPKLPPQLEDRAKDAWLSLFAIADMAGSNWLALANQAAACLSGNQKTQNYTNGIRLLVDIKELFDDLKTDQLTTNDILNRLNGDDTKDWNTYNKNLNPLNSKNLSNLLGHYTDRQGLAPEPKLIRLTSKIYENFKEQPVRRGYYREQFEFAWEHYCPPYLE